MTSARWRARVDWLLSPAEAPRFPQWVASTLLIGLILTSAIAIVLETLEDAVQRFGPLFHLIEAVTVAVMVVEYLLRLWAAPEREAMGARRPWSARRRYATSFVGIVDLIAALPALAALIVPIPVDALRLLRLLRLLKLARYTPALSLFAAVMRNESRPLLATLLVVAVLLVIESAIMYMLERDAQPKVFASIPHAMWWAIVTIATVGYGDIFPITPTGKIFGGAIIAFVYASRQFRSSFDYTLGGVVTGLVVVGGWYVSGFLGHVEEDPNTLQEAFVATNTGRMESFSFVAPFAYTLEYLMLWTDKSKIITYGIASAAGVIAGSAGYALATRTFRWEGFRNAEDTANHIVGGVLMGFGGITALGCTIGQAISGFSTLALGSIITFLAIVAGSAATMKYQYWRAG